MVKKQNYRTQSTILQNGRTNWRCSQMPPDIINDFGNAFLETSWMMGIAVAFAIVIGVPLGVGLFVTSEGMFWQNRVLQSVAGTLINIIRSIPFIILLVVLIPV